MTGSEKQLKSKTDSEKKYWFSPVNLLRTESEVKSLENADLATKGDFASYRALRENRHETNIELHNSTGENAAVMATILTKFIRKFSENPATIADMGCGAGFITAKIREFFPDSAVFGFDLATDAIEYAKVTFSGITFRCCGISADTDFPEIYSIIYAHEFYPFTRTNDFELQAGYVRNFLKHLSQPGGLLLIGLKMTDESLYHNLKLLRSSFGSKAKLRVHYLPIKRIHSIVKILWVSQVLSRIANFALRRQNSIIISMQC